MTDPIAIIGLGCRFPGQANDPESFWRLLAQGEDAITSIPPDRWNTPTYYSPNRNKPGKFYLDQGGFVENIDQFDAGFFGIPPRVAAKMDPQHRLLLEVTWEALEDAGLVVNRLAGTNTGVFIGLSNMEYNTMQSEFEARHLVDAYTIIGSIMSVAANRISHIFDLHGPSLVLDTACSSSLVAVHQACQSIWHDGCTLALAGGVQLQLKPESLIMYSKSTLLSPTGRCHTFDARADGFVRSEGAGVVILKPLAAALADGDRIYALIRGTAVTQDGHTTSLTEPSAKAQAAAIRKALRQARVRPDQVQYVEAHGTGTAVGDPIEATALGQVFGEQGCIVGSVKTNIGHAEAAAGVAGLIKVALALKHRQIPPNLHFETPNPDIPLAELKLHIPTTLEDWPANRHNSPRLAGINSFGIGGTNVHVVVAEAPISQDRPVKPQPATDNRAYLLPLSAHTPVALDDLARRYQEFFSTPAVDLSAVAFNAGARRTHQPHRLALVARTETEVAEKLDAFLAGETRSGLVRGHVGPAQAPLKPVFVFSGMGQQWSGMGRELLAQEPVFQEAVAACDAALQPQLGWSLLAAFNNGETDIDRTEIAQPLIFALQVGLAALWQAWGMTPQAVVGHSVGEAAAAYVSGALSLAEAALVVYHRSRLQAQTAGQGTMLAVAMPAEEMQDWLTGYEDWVSIAAVNSPASVTLAGQQEALQIVADSFTAQQIFNRFVRVEVPYHSPAMEPLVPELEAALTSLSPQSTSIPLVSTVTGQAIAGEVLDGRYWGQNMRAPVQFAAAMNHLVQAGYNAFLEISTHPVLSHSITECLPPEHVVLASLRRDQAERANLLATLAQLYTLDYPLSWGRLYPGGKQHVQLPAYPWQRSRYWYEPEERRQARLRQAAHPLLGRPLDGPGLVWETEIDSDRLTYLKDHRIRGVVVYPSTAYTEMILALGHEVFGEGHFVIENTLLENALILSDDQAPILRTTLDLDKRSFAIHSRQPDTYGRWTRHFSGQLRHHNPGPSPQVDLAEIRQRCLHPISRAEAYERFRAMGYEYGPSFQGIEQGWYGEETYLFEIHLPDSLAKDMSAYYVHPALHDACFHGTALAAHGNNTWLPVGADRIRFYKQPGEKNWLHVYAIKQSDTHLELAAQVLDETGQVLVDVRGSRSQAINETALDLKDHLYQYHWQKEPRPDQPADLSEERWLIFADNQGVGNQLAHSLKQAGGQPVWVSAGDGYRQTSPDHYQICPDDALQFGQVLRAVGSCHKILYLWNLDVGPTDLAAAQDLGSLGLVYLVQSLAQTSLSPQICLVTRGLHALSPADDVAVSQASSWGVGRVMANELPHLQPRLIDLSAAITEPEIPALFEEISLNSNEDEVALRGRERYVHRLAQIELAHLPVRPVSDDAALRLEIAQAGTLAGLEWHARPRCRPGPGEVAIEIRATGLNFKDVVKAMALIPESSLEQTYSGQSLGLECAGNVMAVGPGVQAFKPGDEVLALAPHAFGTYTVTKQSMVISKPAHVTFEQAATLPVVFTTAYYALCLRARLQPQERILIHAAAGGVGQAAVQIAQTIGAEIFATAGSPEKREFLRSQGIEHVFDSRSLAFADEIMALTEGVGIDVVLNSLPGQTIAASLDTLRPQGRFIDLSNFYNDSQVSLRPFQKGLTLMAFDLDQLMQSEPDYFQTLFHEAMQYVFEQGLAALPLQTFSLPEAADAFRYMAQAKHIGKIVITGQGVDQLTPKPAPLDPTTFQGGGTYLITGGLRGFGLASAQWLAAHGAKHLVLVGRSGVVTPEAQQVVAELEAAGVTVRVAPADVADVEQVASVLALIQQSLPPLKGLIHAATVYEDQTLLTLTPDAFQRVMAPKAQGAWNLHHLTRDLRLDFFVLYSSVSAVTGAMGQGSYVGANLFLDALAHHRHHLGLPALSINWGAIGQVGILTRETAIKRYFLEMGLTLLPVDLCLPMLGLLQQTQSPQICVVAVDWSRLRVQLSALAAPRFNQIVAENSTAPVTATNSLRQALQNAAPDEQHAMLLAYLGEQAAQVLGMSPDKLDSTAPLISLGLDSLMAVELSNRLKQQANTTLSALQILSGSNLNQLTEQLLPQVLAVQPERPASSDLRPVPRTGHIPLSYLQEPMWTLHQSRQSSPFYNIPTMVHLQGPLDVTLLEAALQKIIARHDTLRTNFRVVEGQPVQLVAPAGGRLPLSLVPTSPAEAKTLAELEARQPLDLAEGFPIRAKLLQLGPEEHLLLITMHHLVSDGTSAMLLYQELLTLYQAMVHDNEAHLPDLPVQYADFVAWQRQQLQGDHLAALRAYWQSQLQGGMPFLDLPLDHPRPATPTYQGHMEPFRCSLALSDNLKKLARQENVTLFTILLSALAVQVSTYTGLLDFSLGTFTGARTQPALEPLIGCFINALPIRVDLSQNPTFRQLLAQLQETMLAAQAHAQLPFSKIFEAARGETAPQVVLILHNQLDITTGYEVEVILGLVANVQELSNGGAKRDWTFHLMDAPQGLHGFLEYDCDLFKPATTRRVVQEFVTTLTQAVAKPDQCVSHTGMSRTRFDFRPKGTLGPNGKV